MAQGESNRWSMCLCGVLALAGGASCAPSGPASAAAASVSADATPAGRAAQGRNAGSDPFPGRDTVAVAELLAAIAAEAPAIAAAAEVREEYDRLRARHGLGDDDGLYADFVRVRIAFEATRAGGLWGLEWRITDRDPQSDRIWAQWRSADPRAGGARTSTAVAECDELSALFAVVARGIGLSPRSQVGLLWPTSNHTVAVWVVDRPGRTAARIVVPTSQIFLDSAQSLDTDGFDPWRQKRVFDYRRRDVAPDARLPAALARDFVVAVRMHGAAPRGVLQGMRNRREYEQRMAAASAEEGNRR